MKPRFRIDELEARIAPAGLCLADPLFCGSLGGGSAVTADGDAFVGDPPDSICAGDTGGSNPQYTLTTGSGGTVVLQSEATLGICSAVANSLMDPLVPCT